MQRVQIYRNGLECCLITTCMRLGVNGIRVVDGCVAERRKAMNVGKDQLT